MNWSSEPLPRTPQSESQSVGQSASHSVSQSASYLPLEYRDAGEPFSPLPSPTQSNAEDPGSSAGTSENQSGDAGQTSEHAELLDARIEVERRAIRAEARQEAEREIQRARAAINEAIEKFAQQREEYFRHAEEEVVNLALAITRRLIHRESQIDPRLLTGLINYELDQLDTATSVRLFVSPDALSEWNEAAHTLSRPIEIAVDKALNPGDARIETVLGSTTVSFERELKEIERGFFDLLSHRPQASETKTVRVQ